MLDVFLGSESHQFLKTDIGNNDKQGFVEMRNRAKIVAEIRESRRRLRVLD